VDRGLLLEGSGNLVDYFQSRAILRRGGFRRGVADSREYSGYYAVTRNAPPQTVASSEITGIPVLSISVRSRNGLRCARPGHGAIATQLSLKLRDRRPASHSRLIPLQRASVTCR